MVTAFPDLALWALVMAGVTLIFWSLSHVLLQRYRAGTLSALWLLVAVAWLLPVRPASPWGGQATTVGLQLPTQEAGGLASGAPLVQIAAGVAVVGAVVALIRLVFQQRRFLTHVRRWGAVSQDPVLLAAVERAACDLGLKKVPTALEVPGIHTPMVFGVRGTKLLIPAHSPVPEDLVLRHELAHIKRRDPLIRLLLGLIQALQWWNPFVYLIVKNVRESSEIACDQRVLHGVPLGEREDYARSLLRAAVATNPNILVVAFGEKGAYRSRLGAILDSSTRRGGALLAVPLIFAFGLTGVPVALQSSPALSEGGSVAEPTPSSSSWLFEGALDVGSTVAATDGALGSGEEVVVASASVGSGSGRGAQSLSGSQKSSLAGTYGQGASAKTGAQDGSGRALGNGKGNAAGGDSSTPQHSP